jgi:hypothetical protein
MSECATDFVLYRFNFDDNALLKKVACAAENGGIGHLRLITEMV